MFWMGDSSDSRREEEGGKTKKQRKRYDILKTASCTVCGDQAAEHLHYGGIACYSCRAFFRRTVNSNRPILECSGTQNCKINKETRKRCQWCRFEKCKLVGMKTTWVLTEDDKTKLALRRGSSPVPGINIGNQELTAISIKQEETLDGALSPGSSDSITVKQRHNSSPMSPDFEHFGQAAPYKPSTSPFFSPPPNQQPRTDNTNPFFPNQFYPFQQGFPGPEAMGDITQSQQFFQTGPSSLPGPYGGNRGGGQEQASSLFPLNINKMQVSLSGPSDGLSFTIETHNTSGRQRDSLDSHHNLDVRKSEDGGGPMRHHHESRGVGALSPLGEAGNSRRQQQDGRAAGALSPQGDDNNPRRHHQQSRTIFRCISNDSDSQCSASPDPAAHSRTNSNNSAHPQFSGNSGHSGLNGHPGNQGHQGQQGPQGHPGYLGNPGQIGNPGRPQGLGSNEQSLSYQPREMWGRQQPGGLSNFPDHANVNVWKLEEQLPAAEDGRPALKSFTLQETLFVEQLAAIDERVRFQVPMDLEHVQSFMNISLSGTFISKMTIMHAYQTCIKRIVRFANSLQDFVELPPDDMQKLLVANTVSIINIRIIRWFHPNIDLKKQLLLCLGGQDLFQEALNSGKVTEPGHYRVNYDDVFSSPWCCDSYFEERYEVLMKEMHSLSLDSTIMVLLSVMCLFDCNKVEDLSAQATIVSHGQKFALLLQRYLLEQGSEEQARATFAKYQDGLAKLREMAEILINKRLIC